jgi:hypothetical protein
MPRPRDELRIPSWIRKTAFSSPALFDAHAAVLEDLGCEARRKNGGQTFLTITITDAGDRDLYTDRRLWKRPVMVLFSKKKKKKKQKKTTKKNRPRPNACLNVPTDGVDPCRSDGVKR